MSKVGWGAFLKDVFIAALGSYGGPEAHYGVFQSQLVEDKNYLTAEELSELIGIHSLVPGPGSTQTITAIGYHVGGPILALLTFLVWAFPAIVVMALFGVFLSRIDGNNSWAPILNYLPAAAIGFIIYAAINMTRKMNQTHRDWVQYVVMLIISFVFGPRSIWAVPIILIIGGLITLIPRLGQTLPKKIQIQPNWWILFLLISIAIINELINNRVNQPLINLFTSFYRYGYSAMGGGQIVIPLMIQDLVESQSLISRADFLSGYAIDQAIPGPLFSFAAFVAARAMVGMGTMPSFLAGLVGGLAIFLPGILLVFFLYPLWHSLRKNESMKLFLKGVTLTVAALITMTAITQIIALPVDFISYFVVIASAILLLSKKVPAPLIILMAGVLGFLMS